MSISPLLRILLIGSGGREHALAWKLAQSALVEHIFVCPGNGGTSLEHKTTNLSDVQPDDFSGLVQFAVQNTINLVVPGPEQPLVDGIETVFRKVGIPVFGPTKSAARMEGSKAFAKEFMHRHSIPTAKFKIFKSSEINEAINYVETCGHKVVLKASGLAAGKGVLIPNNIEEAIQGLKDVMVDKIFGDAGDHTVIEELLIGPEISVLALADGYTIIPLSPGQDHKRIGEGDTGPNTGGMGVYAPAPVATKKVMDQIMNETLRPSIDGMRKEGFPFVGLLFTGFILTSDGPKVLEYNVRFGDPETEALMLLLSPDTDLGAVLQACVERRLDSVNVFHRPGVTVAVVLASQGYPGPYEKGKQINIPTPPQDVVVFHAGTTFSGDALLTSGGRVLVVTAYAMSLQSALALAYDQVDKIEFPGKTFRRDIAHRALNAPSSQGLTYAQAGVSVDAGNALVELIKPLVRATKRVGADAELGGFGGIFDLKAIGYTDPLLVGCTDGVGTKLRVANDVGIHDLVGIDLVAMSVNDLLAQGAEPLFFLDYYACGKLDVSVASEVIKGIAEGCRQSRCALIGGETAEMPGMYQGGDYDLCGFAVGAVERTRILPRTDVTEGDVLIGIGSSGLHSNGFSLVRKIINRAGLSHSSPCPWDDSVTLGQSLLTPTEIYVAQVLPVIRMGLIKAVCHITGGGFVENLPRVLPKHLGCYVDAAAWELPPIFKLIKRHGVDSLEMSRTFNNGVGLVLVVSARDVEQVVSALSDHGERPVFRIGEVTAHVGVEMRNLEAWEGT